MKLDASTFTAMPYRAFVVCMIPGWKQAEDPWMSCPRCFPNLPRVGDTSSDSRHLEPAFCARRATSRISKSPWTTHRDHGETAQETAEAGIGPISHR